jgi:hypothetical protein
MSADRRFFRLAQAAPSVLAVIFIENFFAAGHDASPSHKENYNASGRLRNSDFQYFAQADE